RLVDQAVAVAPPADVAGDGDGAPPGRRVDRLGDGLARVDLPRGDDDVGARLRERLHDGPSDSAGSAGDDGNLAGQVVQCLEGRRQPTGPDGHWLEPLTVLTAVAAQTTRVRLGTYILLAALRRPVILAKQLATLDVISRGRVDLGVGIGWQREEYEAAGLDF